MPLLLCDLDDTLVSRAAVFEEWCGAFVSAHRLPDDAVDWLTEHDQAGRRERPDFFAAVTERYELSETVEQLTELWRADFATRYRLPEPNRSALIEARAAGWRIGVVTNGREQVQLTKLDACDVHSLVDAICISEEIGAAKPDLRIFGAAAVRAGCSLRGGWMIGDNPEADVGGGQNAGLRTAWLRLGRTWAGRCRPPTVQADSFAEAVTQVLTASPPR